GGGGELDADPRRADGPGHPDRPGLRRCPQLRPGGSDRPHRAVAERLPGHPDPRRDLPLRPGEQRPHPGPGQPARSRQPPDLPHRRRRATQPRGVAGHRRRAPGQLVAGLPALAGAALGRAQAQAEDPRQQGTRADRGRPRHVRLPDLMATADIRYVEVDGMRLRTSIRGAGRPLLLLTGIGASLSLSAPFEDALNPYGVQTIAVDAPGTGRSTRYRRPRRMPGLARTFELLLDALGYEQVDVLGASFGGVLAQQLAHQAPSRVRRLVLAATGAGVAGLGGVPGSPRALLALAT